MERILHILSQLKKNGSETFVLNLYRNIDRSKFQFDFLIFSDSRDGYYDEIISMGGRVFSIKSRRQSPFEYYKELDLFFSRHSNDYSIVHFHPTTLTTIAPLIYAKKYCIKRRIVHMHGAGCPSLHNKLLHYINRLRINRIATDFLGCSKEALNWGFRHKSLPRSAKVITNGIEIDKYIYNPSVRNKMRRALNLEDKFVIGHIGSFNVIKNHKFLLEIFKTIKIHIPNATLICIGDGELLEYTKKKAKKYGIEDSVVFTGRRDDIPSILQAIDVMAMPSLHEGLGFALIEAQAASIPIVAASTIPKTVKLSENVKFLSLAESPEKWGNVIMEYIGYKRDSIDNNHKIQLFSIFRTVKEMENIYRLP